MSFKIINYFLLCIFLLFIKRVTTHEIIEKYGKKETNNKYIFLHTSDFDNGDKIYITISNHDGYDTSTINYKFFENIDNINVNNIETLSTVRHSSKSYEDTTYGYTIEIFDYIIKKEDKNGNYLYLKFDFNPPVTVENTKGSNTTTIIIVAVVIGVVVIAVFIIIMIIYCRRCKNNQAYENGINPANIGYQVSPYASQPVGVAMQPVANVQPYEQNQNYNVNQNEQVNQGLRESEFRANQDKIKNK